LQVFCVRGGGGGKSISAYIIRPSVEFCERDTSNAEREFLPILHKHPFGLGHELIIIFW